MNFKIDEMWQSDSILYSYITKRIVNTNNIENFKNQYLTALKEKDEDRIIELMQWFKENISDFVNNFKDQIDYNLFIELITEIENYYQKSIKGEFYYFRYYQYLSFLYTYIFISLKNETSFKLDFLDYIKTSNILTNTNWFDIENYLNYEFKRMGFWMATWSWKTLIMYWVIYMYLRFNEEKYWDKLKNLIIIVPSNELRRQHKDFLTWFWKDTLASIKDQWTIVSFDNILLFGKYEISWKLTTIQWISNEKVWENSLLLIDEAHKWAWLDSSSESWLEWLKARFLNWNWNFMFEFSATFQKAFEKNLNDSDNIFNTYILSSIYKYNLYNFNVDWFGKNYFIETWSQQEDSDKKVLILNSLMNYFKQLEEFDKKEEISKITQSSFQKKWAYLENKWERLYKPLYVWLSYKLDSENKESEDSLKDIIKNIITIFQNLDEYEDELVNNTISINKFFKLFTWIEYKNWEKPNISIYYDKVNDEIRLYLGNNIMLVNTWQNKKISETLIADEEMKIYVSNKIFQDERLFSKIDERDNILFLFGSRKFVEWWDSKRPSTILLFKMWKTWTILSTQILGRWIRLFWYKWDWFRRLWKTNNWNSNPLECINIFGYDIQEFKSFIESISEELYKVAIVKKRQFSSAFIDFLKEKNIQNNDQEIESLFKKYFKIVENKLNTKKKVFEDIKVLNVNINSDNKLIFTFQWDEVSKLSPKYDDFLVLDSGGIVDWTWRFNWISTVTEIYTFWNIFNDESLNTIFLNYFENRSKFNVSPNDYDTFFNYVKLIQIETDKFMHLYKNQFSIDKQFYKINYFENKIYEILDYVSNKLVNKETTWKEDIVWNIKLTNLIENINLSFQLNKDNNQDKDIIKMFFGDSSKFIVERNYDDLNDEQKLLLDSYFIQNNKDCHIYERLYYIDKKEVINMNHIHNIKDNNSLSNYDINPSELKLNNNEENKIVKVLKMIKNQWLDNKYHIFYLRNIRWKQWTYLWYENKSWKYAKFYPDFLIWFINKNDNDDITLVYYEPKWASIDQNIEEKRELFNEISSWLIDTDITNIFHCHIREDTWENSKYWNLKVFWTIEIED